MKSKVRTSTAPEIEVNGGAEEDSTSEDYDVEVGIKLNDFMRIVSEKDKLKLDMANLRMELKNAQSELKRLKSACTAKISMITVIPHTQIVLIFVYIF